MVSRDSERDLQPRPRELTWSLVSSVENGAKEGMLSFRSRHQSRSYFEKNSVNPKRNCLHHKPEMDIFFEEESDGFPEEVARVDCFINFNLRVSWKLWIESCGFFIWFAGRVVTLTSWQDCTSEILERPVVHRSKRTWSITGVSLRTIFLEFS